jgi:hypothetical protein
MKHSHTIRYDEHKTKENIHDMQRTNHPFPQIDIENRWFKLSSELTYEPKCFNRKIMRDLQEILDEACDIGGCENPEVVADWYEYAQNDGQITSKSTIILYKDGGDWGDEEDGHYEGIGLLFCREDLDLTVNPSTTIYRVHIPDTEGQDKLLPCCEDLIEDLARGNAEKLNTIRAYLKSIINDQTAWKSLRALMQEQVLA